MFSLLRLILKKAPLLTSVLLVWLILTIIAFVCRGRAYQNYAEDYGKHPGVSVVLRGFHDHVMPWSRISAGDGGDTDGKDQDQPGPGEGQETSGGQDSGEKSTKQEDPDSRDQDDESGPDPREKDSGEDLKESGTQDKDTGEDQQEKEKSPENKDPQVKAASGEGEKTEKSPDKGGSRGGAKKAAAETDGKTGAEDGNIKAAAKGLRIPESSASPVVPAKDYGVADSRYLSPEGTVYNTDSKGLFAPDKTFYSFQEVDDKYFEDALFIGDSRTVGLYEYGGIASSTSFLARESTTVYDLFDDKEKMDYTPRGKKTTERTLKDLLSKAKFRKIYLSVGVNELGIPDTLDYYKEFRKVLEKINRLQPDAIIYIQGIMHVSKAVSSTDPVFNNKAIVQRNTAISTLANGRSIFYVDMNSAVCDKNGDLKDEVTGDGIHLKASACSLWYDYLKKHAIVIPD